jgi:hypothetical protein
MRLLQISVHYRELSDRAHDGHCASHDADRAPLGERDGRDDKRAEAKADKLATSELAPDVISYAVHRFTPLVSHFPSCVQPGH